MIDKTKEELIEEIKLLQKRIAEFEKDESKRKEMEDKVIRHSVGMARINVDLQDEIKERKKAQAEAVALKKQAEFILGVTKTGLDIIDSDFNMVYIDPEWQKVYGNPNGKKCYKYFMGSNTVCPNCGIVKALKTKKPVVNEEVLSKEGNRPIQVTSMPFQDEKGNWLVAEVNVDITERKKAEEELRESEAVYRALVETTDTGYVIIDKKGKVIDANKEYIRLTGRTGMDEIRGRYVIEWTADYEKKKNEEAVAKCVKDGYIRNLEVDYIDKHGKIIPVEINATVVAIGGMSRILTLCRDITERKKAEDKIKVFSDAIAGAFDCFMLTDMKGNITYANESASTTFGYTPEEFLKLNITELDADPKVAKKIAQETMAKGKWSGEVTNIRKNNEKFPSLLSAFIIKDDKGNPKGTMGILRDISKRKRAEEGLRKSEQELREDKLLLEQKNLTLKELIEHMEREKNKTKEDIAINVDEFIIPVLKKLKIKGASPKYVKLLEHHFKELTSSFGRKITQRSARLTPREIEICNMIKGNLASKDISELLNVSCQTIEKHRKNVRKKLGLSNKKANLASYLQKI